MLSEKKFESFHGCGTQPGMTTDVRSKQCVDSLHSSAGIPAFTRKTARMTRFTGAGLSDCMVCLPNQSINYGPITLFQISMKPIVGIMR